MSTAPLADKGASGKPLPSSYRRIDSTKIVATGEALGRRIAERFPDSALCHIASEFVPLARNASATAEWLAAPHRWVRASAALGLLILAAASAAALWSLDLRMEAFSTLSDLAQGLEAAVGDAVFVGLAVFFLFSIEARIKRRRALAVIHELRAMAHIIDMHQLSKDPERLDGRGEDTESSPERHLTPFELTRYLDYSSELLALISKLGAILVQGFDDPVTLSAVNEIEELTSGMSRKIWQKITIVDRFLSRGGVAG
jgi:hypothetical protein